MRNLSEKTLTMEDPRLAFRLEDQSQEMPVSSEEDISDLENNQQQSKETKKSQDFSQQTVDDQKKILSRYKIRYSATRTKYSPTRIKTRNFLSNISNSGINKNDFYSENFILDVYVLLVKNLNPFSLTRNISDKTKHEMVYMLCRECIPSDFYRYICEEKNFIYLNG